MERFLGIDFGTTNSAMAWSDGTRAGIIKNAELEAQTPSLVYYGPDGIQIGRAVASLIEDLGTETDPGARAAAFAPLIASVKRQLGKRRMWAIGSGKAVSAIDVTAAILRKLKHDAEEFFFNRQEVPRAVLTHPASFESEQKRALEQAATQAGFKEVKLLKEPEAAAIAYARAGLQVGVCVLVYDLGGGTFDLAVVTRADDGSYQRVDVREEGRAQCGGDDFDRALYDYWDAQVRAQTGQGINVIDGIDTDMRFLMECRKRKENLSHGSGMTQSFYSLLPGGRRVKLEIDRRTFEGLIRPLVAATARDTVALVDQARDAGHTVDTVVLIGGASQVPLVSELLADALPVAPRRWHEQDVAVALGAGYHAAQLWGHKPKPVPQPAPVTPTAAETRPVLPSPAPVRPAQPAHPQAELPRQQQASDRAAKGYIGATPRTEPKSGGWGWLVFIVIIAILWVLDKILPY